MIAHCGRSRGMFSQILTKLNIRLGRKRWQRLEESWNPPRVAERVDSNWRTGAGMLHWDCCPKIEMLAGGRGAVGDILNRRHRGQVGPHLFVGATGTGDKYSGSGCR
ncbi:hypothetical protein [Kamptonema formosum]|uniref:hypothetical protein n=1 Tax=Kamptonema formosum TaxID=331992 RepID=UPI000369572B|nr:hypothetical protein [Oscillatoria sp. PCC 10802]